MRKKDIEEYLVTFMRFIDITHDFNSNYPLTSLDKNELYYKQCQNI